jgi:hypothetical protein
MKRVALYAGAILAVAAVVTLISTANASYVNRFVLREVNASLMETKNEIRAVRTEFRQRAAADSVRFERVLDIVEVAVVALVEEPGSEEQRSAVAELRKRRRVTPR